MNYYDRSIDDIVKEFNSNSKSGLSESKANEHIKKYGLNELTQKKGINPFILFISQFKSFIIYVLLFALVISIISNEYIDATVIFIILLFNAVFGFVQEYRAEKSLDSLKKLASLKSTVIRDGKKISIDSKLLVPGDIIVLEEGNKVPADARLIEVNNLHVSESILTGESVPVSKKINLLKGQLVVADQKNMIFSGTAISSGTGRAIIVKTGMTTEIGKIAEMVTSTEKEITPLQRKLEVLGKKIVWVTLVLCILVFIAGAAREGIFAILWEGKIWDFILASKDWLLTAVSLAVAAVPEGLPAVVTIALAIGVKKMLKKNALIRRLPSVESLGEATVICSDKTGTLTKNEMTVRAAYIAGKYFELTGLGYDTHGAIVSKKGTFTQKDRLLFECGVLCNNSELSSKGIIGDPTEASLLVSAQKAGIVHDLLNKEWIRQKELPFDSNRKLMGVVCENKKTSKKIVYTKGAPEMLLEKCTKIWDGKKTVNLTSSMKRKIQELNEEMGSKALRVLGFAYKPFNAKKKIEEELIFIGLQGMIDPPHSQVKGAIKKCYQAGIRVIMITGDNIHTAKGIAKEIGILGDAMLGSDFANLNEAKQIEVLKKVSIFARVEPSHKMRIVDLLQQEGEIVAMTGDGVNDAPAIKSADLGIAMGISGTDVTKESSDMILLDDNFTSIVNAIEEGRGIYQNIKKFVNYLLSSNVAEVLVIFIAIVFGWALPMTAIMILWLNLVTDGLPALALSVDPNPKDLMSKPPKKKNDPIMNNSMVINIIIVAFFITIGVLFLFDWGAGFNPSNPADLAKSQTLVFTSLVVLEIVRLQAIRSEYDLKMFSNKWLVYAVGASFILQLAVIYTPLNQYFGTVPLGVMDWTMILIVAVLVGAINYVIKKAFRNSNGSSS